MSKLPKTVCTAVFSIDDAVADAVANGDKTVTVDIKTIETLLTYAKKQIVKGA